MMAGMPEAGVATYVSGWCCACTAGMYDSDSNTACAEMASDCAGV